MLSTLFLVAGMMAVDDANARGGRGSGARGGGHSHRAVIGVSRVFVAPPVRYFGGRPLVAGVAVGVAAPLAYSAYPGYYGPESYYYSPYYEDPPVYVEPAPAPFEQVPAAWWYFCRETNTYYPYVRRVRAGGNASRHSRRGSASIRGRDR